MSVNVVRWDSSSDDGGVVGGGGYGDLEGRDRNVLLRCVFLFGIRSRPDGRAVAEREVEIRGEGNLSRVAIP
jgi:hypothetical protein